ncbi:MAG: mannose-1-phosphate guanylyltransferase, partial [Rubrivivax sp.]|nr:mannose-1-phosphate guanylyltransferase [Rubrivivax sp.]
MSPTPQVLVWPVVMAGGSGTRLWPLSRSGYPKQFLALTGTGSLFQQAVSRLQGLGNAQITVGPPVVVGNEEHRFLVLDQLREIQAEPAAVLLEPMGRNTAPAVTLAALQALESGHDPVMVVTPADQTVSDGEAFTLSLRRAVLAAAEGAIAILGITPDRPETGYGYIRADGSKVAQFVEKPDLPTAQQYLNTGGYYWNAGMFVLRASVWMSALERFRPDIANACRAAFAARTTDAVFVRPGREEFAAVPAESVDYAVMEKCPNVLDIRMEPLAAGWNDLGAWEAVWQVSPKDSRGNAAVGDAIFSDCDNTLVHATSRLVSVVGLKD